MEIQSTPYISLLNKQFFRPTKHCPSNLKLLKQVKNFFAVATFTYTMAEVLSYEVAKDITASGSRFRWKKILKGCEFTVYLLLGGGYK